MYNRMRLKLVLLTSGALALQAAGLSCDGLLNGLYEAVVYGLGYAAYF